MSGQWLRLWDKKNGFVTFSLNWKDSRPFEWLNWIQTTSSLLSLLKIGRSQISCVPGEATNRETRVSRLCRSTLSRLGKDKTRYCWCDTRGLMSPLSKHICLRGKDQYKSMNWWNKKYLKERKNSKHNKSCLQYEACLRIKTESPNANYDTSLHMFECSQNMLIIICLHPPPSHTPPLATAPCCFHSVAGQRSRLPSKYHEGWLPFLSIRKSKYQRDIASKMK